MTPALSKDDAALALGAASDAHARMARLRRYAAASPFLILWGLIWLCANAATDFDPRWSSPAWTTGMAVGIPLTVWLGFRSSRYHRGDRPPAEAKRFWRAWGLTNMAVFVFFAASVSILEPISARQGNAYTSLFWACLYMGVGAWAGWRLLAIGAATAVGVLVGYFFVHEHYYLWMALVGGGSLVAGGLWLRSA